MLRVIQIFDNLKVRKLCPQKLENFQENCSQGRIASECSCWLIAKLNCGSQAEFLLFVPLVQALNKIL